jgi:hypothetical protein
MVVWLDAADTNLVQLINGRSQRHAVKGKPEEEAAKYLAHYRMSYEQVWGKLSAYGRPMLLQFDTTQASVEQIVEQVYARLHPY